MEILLTVSKATFVLLAVVGIAISLIEQRHNYEFIWSVWKRFRVKMFFEVLGVITLTIALTVALWQVPGFKYGWTNFFFDRSSNALIGPIFEGSQSTSILVRLMVPLFFIALMFVLPFLARDEERIFRKRHDEWGSIIKQSIKFGLVHCLVGIPLAGGFALIISGFFYGYKYKRAFDRNIEAMGYRRAENEAVMVSTTYHTMYNMILVAILLLVTLAAV